MLCRDANNTDGDGDCGDRGASEHGHRSSSTRLSRFRHPRQAVKAAIGFITEDRKAEGLALGQSIADNMMLAVRTVLPARTPKQLIKVNAARTIAARYGYEIGM